MEMNREGTSLPPHDEHNPFASAHRANVFRREQLKHEYHFGKRIRGMSFAAFPSPEGGLTNR